eukprot:CAMPEP_0179210894 /NCGR_PEP_ID=MMETSP0797-20121207/30_1 /TAXON_ID=47934 /ORGANISM="Dinophysis acuminata, Strain DAEP01" /LENGTH=87 /DNA_ID=CAMNT_0020915899 /DNA_START=706 /DNA_END=965 /DNA_ORIENTATION=+
MKYWRRHGRATQRRAVCMFPGDRCIRVGLLHDPHQDVQKAGAAGLWDPDELEAVDHWDLFPVGLGRPHVQRHGHRSVEAHEQGARPP